MSEACLLGVDPGTAKCGLVVLDCRGEVLHRAVVSREELPAALAALAQRFPLGAVALGDLTGVQAVRRVLAQALPDLAVRMVPEHRTSERARELYWRYHPPRGWRRLIPRGMLLPPEPLDAYAAELIARLAREADSPA